MTELTIWGSSDPPGTTQYFTDGGDPVTEAATFYTYGAISEDFKIIGGRVFCPATATSDQLTVYCWTKDASGDPGVNTASLLDGVTVPERTVTVDVVPGEWVEARWEDNPLDLPPDGYRWAIGFQYSDDEHYNYNNTVISETLTSTPAGVALEPDNETTDYNGPCRRHAVRIGSGVFPPTNAYYPIDTIVSDDFGGGGGEPAAGTSVTDLQYAAVGGTGSLADRQYAYMKDKVNPSSPKSITDLQVADGQAPSLFIEVE